MKVGGCRCGHSYYVHEHYRPGSDCAFRASCGCTGYRSWWAIWRRNERA